MREETAYPEGVDVSDPLGRRSRVKAFRCRLDNGFISGRNDGRLVLEAINYVVVGAGIQRHDEEP